MPRGSGFHLVLALLHEDPLRVGRLGPRFSGSSAGATLRGCSRRFIPRIRRSTAWRTGRPILQALVRRGDVTARVAPSWGGQATSGAEALWGRETMAGLARGGVADGTRLEAELGQSWATGCRSGAGWSGRRGSASGLPRWGGTTGWAIASACWAARIPRSNSASRPSGGSARRSVAETRRAPISGSLGGARCAGRRRARVHAARPCASRRRSEETSRRSATRVGVVWLPTPGRVGCAGQGTEAQTARVKTVSLAWVVRDAMDTYHARARERS